MKLSKLFTALCMSALLAGPGLTLAQAADKHALVLMTDFGTSDGAVSAMRGVAFGVDPSLHVSDLTHNIPDYDIWLGAYRLYQTANYWPVGSVFV
ncbi:MAG: SAM-dependent chlorinase/fluorinase, partial [Duganella sp.]